MLFETSFVWTERRQAYNAHKFFVILERLELLEELLNQYGRC